VISERLPLRSTILKPRSASSSRSWWLIALRVTLSSAAARQSAPLRATLSTARSA
jgi:hypothetical protein